MSWPCFQRNAQVLAHGHNFFDGATAAAGEDGIGYFAEPCEFGESPERASAASERSVSGMSHEWFFFYSKSLHRVRSIRTISEFQVIRRH
jgi:pyruvoyl-dependent arginine decarboxylase (PvlArgDC)